LTGLGGATFHVSEDCNKNGTPDECDAQLVLGACPEKITVQAIDDVGIVVEYPTPPTENGCNVVVTVEPPSGLLFPIGITTVTVTAMDDAGAVLTCSFEVEVLPPGSPAPQPAEQGVPPFGFPCIPFLFQSTCGIPLCGPCFGVSLLVTCAGMVGMRRRIRRRRLRR
jgi:hypothetical protein